MNKEDIIKEVFKHNKIVIIGYPDSRKSTLFFKISKQEEAKEYYMIQTDSLIFKDGSIVPFEDQLYNLIDLLSGQEKYIVEGIQGCRFLRKIAQNKKVFPLKSGAMESDLIIICRSSAKPLDKHLKMRKSLDKIWNDYTEIEKNLPKIIEYVIIIDE